MAAYHYSALNLQGKTIKGVMEGDSSRQIRQKLRDMHYTPLEVILVTEKKSRKTVGKAKRIKVADLALLTRQLATLLTAGLPVEEALQAVAEQTEKDYIKGIIIGVRSRVMEGMSLAMGLKEFPRAFPHLYQATVAAGEQAGHLDLILNRLADYIEKQHRMQQKIKQALIYPSLMTLISIIIVVFLLIFVVPKIIGVFSESAQSLPAATSILLAASEGIKNYGLYIAVFLVAVLITTKQLIKRNYHFRYSMHMQLLRIPILGNTLKAINSARFSRTFGILFAASVPVLEAMRVANELVRLLPMKEAIAEAINRVREGASISSALTQTGFFSPMSVHLMASGEASGQLEAMLERTADNQDNDVALLIENSLALFEPLMIIIMGGIVLFIVLAVLLPIFQLDALAGQG